MKKSNLSREPYKGVRDFYPDEMRLRNYFFDIVREVVKSYGFDEYDASILEESALYRAKTGDEIVNEQTYNFIDRGGREVTLRPEMTPSVARMIARKRKELTFPLKWFNIGRRYRYERMQKGRMREFWQLDCDVFGTDSILADCELIGIPYKILKKFGAEDKNFEIRLNHRGLTNYILRNYLSLDEDSTFKVSKLIDRKAKMPEDEFVKMIADIVEDKKDDLLEILEIADLEKLPEKIKQCQDYENLAHIFQGLENLGIKNFRYDSTLMRGFDYYTGVVFEVFDTDHKNGRSVFGGGRYDNLVGIFGVEKVSGIGFGMGDVVIMDFLRDYDLLPTDDELREGIYVCLLGEGVREFAEKYAENMRRKNEIIDIDNTGKKLGDQIKIADKKGRKFVVIIGENEKNSGKARLKNLVSGEEIEIDLENICQ